MSIVSVNCVCGNLGQWGSSFSDAPSVMGSKAVIIVFSEILTGIIEDFCRAREPNDKDV